MSVSGSGSDSWSTRRPCVAVGCDVEAQWIDVDRPAPQRVQRAFTVDVPLGSQTLNQEKLELRPGWLRTAPPDAATASQFSVSPLVLTAGAASMHQLSLG